MDGQLTPEVRRDREFAEELVQDTFVLAYQHWEHFIPGSECRAWLFTICRRRILP